MCLSKQTTLSSILERARGTTHWEEADTELLLFEQIVACERPQFTQLEIVDLLRQTLS